MSASTTRPYDALSSPLRGRWLVEASAGTGKTWTLSWLFVRFVVEEGLGVEQIAVVTYTNAAAAELRDRLRKRLVEALRAVERARADDGEVDAEDVPAWVDDPDGPPAWLDEAPPAWDGAGGGPWDGEAGPSGDNGAAGGGWDGEPSPERGSGADASEADGPGGEAGLMRRWQAAPGGLRGARDRLTTAIADFDRAMVATIHAFCLRALRDFAFQAGDGFGMELDAAVGSQVDTVTADLWTAAMAGAPVAFVAWMNRGTWSTGAARAVVGAAIGAVRAALVPGDAPSVDLDAACARWSVAVGGFGAAWAAGGRDEALALGGHPSLNGRVYQARYVASTVSKVDAWLEAPSPLSESDCSDLFGRLTTERLLGAVKAGKEAPLPGVLAAVDALIVDAVATHEAWGAAQRATLLTMAARAQAVVDKARPTPTTVYFDDVLRRLDDALDRPGGAALAASLREAFPAVLVDEFQDTDPVQDRIFDRIHPDDAGALVLVGDPKQAIYAFRGADLHTYQAAARRIGDRRRSLATNFRSDAALLDAVAWLFEAQPDPFAGAGVRFEPVAAHHGQRLHGPWGAPLHLLVIPREGAAAAIADDIAAALRLGLQIGEDGARRPVRPGDCAVLVGSHATGRAVAAALIRRGVPVVRRGAQSVLATAEARAVATWMRAALSPGRVDRLKAALATSIGGWTSTRLVALDVDAALLHEQLQRAGAWRELWLTRGFQAMFRASLADCGTVERLLGQLGGERALTDLRHAAELIHAAEREERLGPNELLQWLEAAFDDEADADVRQVRLETDAAAVSVLTLHTSKGLQFPLVWVVGLMQTPRRPALPELHDADGRRVLVIEADSEAEDGATAERLQERLRLAYVGLTRAEHATVAVVDVGKRADRGALPWLLGLSEEEEDVAGALEAHVAASGGRIEVRTAPLRPRAAAVADARPDPRPPRAPQRRLLPDQRITSFSGLVATAVADDDGVDTDAHAVHRPVDPDRPSPLPLATFPRGTEAGTTVHGALELLDFADPEGEAARAVIEGALRAGGIDPAVWTGPLQVGLAAALRTPIEADGFCLADLPRADRVDEMDFVLAAGTEDRPVGGEELAADLARFGDPVLARAYAGRLRRIGGRLSDASLKGFIDLVYRREGRFYVVDYKTNHLGVEPDDYDAPGLLSAMVEGDYLLQAALYTLAVHRFLGVRLPDYDYDQHFGGVRYLFLRGMRPETGAARGVFAFRPERAWIEAWDARLRGEVPG